MVRADVDRYDSDCNSKDLSKHDFLGSVEVSLGEIVASSPLKKPVKGPRPNAGFAYLQFLA